MPTAEMIRAREAIAIVDDYGNVAGGASSHHRQAGIGQACGLYDPTATYFAMNVVAFNGSEWRAMRDNPGPLPGDGWALGAKGARGRPGEPGKPGLSVKALTLTGYTLTVALSDGSTLRVNLLPMLEHFKKETGT